MLGVGGQVVFVKVRRRFAAVLEVARCGEIPAFLLDVHDFRRIHRHDPVNPVEPAGNVLDLHRWIRKVVRVRTTISSGCAPLKVGSTGVVAMLCQLPLFVESGGYRNGDCCQEPFALTTA